MVGAAMKGFFLMLIVFGWASVCVAVAFADQTAVSVGVAVFGLLFATHMSMAEAVRT